MIFKLFPIEDTTFIQVLIHLWHVEILIVCVLDKITVLFSISISSKYILQILIDLQIDLGEKQKHIYLLCELHKITSRKYEGMFLLDKKWKNSVKMFYLLSCYNASEQLSGHQISKFSQTPGCIWLASLAVASGNFGPVNYHLILHSRGVRQWCM